MRCVDREADLDFFNGVDFMICFADNDCLVIIGCFELDLLD